MATKGSLKMPQWIDEHEAAGMIGLAVPTLQSYRSRLNGGPPYYKFGRAVRYRVDEIEAWAASRRVDPEKQRQEWGGKA